MGLIAAGYGLSYMEVRWLQFPKYKTKTSFDLWTPKVPVFLSTKATDILPRAQELTHLYNISKVQDPIIDIRKLRIALSHSSLLVSVFCNVPAYLQDEEDEPRSTPSFFSIPSANSNGKLVGFGRAVSDLGLTASIYDVMVIPSMRRMGVGRLIVNKITRLLTSKDIYDISAVCYHNERLFFKACGFGNDILGSTTMMYTRKVQSLS